MTSEIIYVCHSVNNKNVRRGELKILRNREEELYFEFGEVETNIKKRFYNDKQTLRKDFAALQKLKIEEDALREKENKVEVKPIAEPVVEKVEDKKEEKLNKEETEEQKESKKKYSL